MKEYRQDLGGRRIKGDDLLAIQDTALLSERFLGQYDNFVISGCEINEAKTAINSGIVMLDGKACFFNGASDIAIPYYVKKKVKTDPVPYESGMATGSGYEIFSAEEAKETDSGAFRLDNAPRFADIFKPRNADMVDGKHATDFSEVKIVTDWNNITGKAGDIFVGVANALNKPSTSYFTAIALPLDNNADFLYLLGIDANIVVWKRQRHNGVWHEWQNVADGGAAQSLQNTRTLWGQNFNGTSNVSGNMTSVGHITMNKGMEINGVGAIEMFHSTPAIDFHYNHSNSDYTNRIIEGLEGQLTVTGKLRVGLNHALSSSYKFHVTGGDARFDNSVSIASSVSAAAGFYQSSDERLKDIKEDFEPTLEDITELPLFYYALKDATDKIQVGTSAQKLMHKFPELVTQDDDGYYSVAYDKLAVLALKGVSLLKDEVLSMKNKLEKIEEHLNLQ